MGFWSSLFGPSDPQEGDTVYLQNPESDETDIIAGTVFVAPGDEYPELGNYYDINYPTEDPRVTGITFVERDEFITEKEVSKPWWALW